MKLAVQVFCQCGYIKCKFIFKFVIIIYLLGSTYFERIAPVDMLSSCHQNFHCFYQLNRFKSNVKAWDD